MKAKHSFFLWMLLAPTLLADAAKGPKYGLVNFELAISQETEAQKYIRELETEENKINDDEQKARQDIEKEMSNYKTAALSLSEKARQEKEAQLGQKINSLQQQFNQRRELLLQKRQERLRELENKNRLLLESLSKNGGYDIVFNSQALVYISETIKNNDLTSALVSAYNKAYPVKPEPAKTAPKAIKK